MKRQRGRSRKPSGGSSANNANPNRSWDSQGPENIKVRGNAQTVYERYQQLARDASASGDRVLAENYLQHAEHYFRVLRALQPQRPVSEIAARELSSQGFDIDFEDESGAQAAAFLAAQQAADRAQAEREQAQRAQAEREQANRDQSRDRGDWQSRDRNGQNRGDQGRSDQARNDHNRGDQARSDQPRDNDRSGQPRESRREYWERRNAERREREAAEAAARETGAEASEQPADAPRPVQPDRIEAAPAPHEQAQPAVVEPVAAEAPSDDAGLPGFLTRPTQARDEAAPKAPRTRSSTPRATTPKTTTSRTRTPKTDDVPTE